jgi:uncharacterized protein (TIGR02646 family)
MIRVDRARVPAPRTLKSRAVAAALDRAEKFFRRPAQKRAQEIFLFDFEPLAADDVREALDGLFHSKCAYCEQFLPPEVLVVDHFRPHSGAVDLDGSFSLDHYWWLTYEWQNLYPACAECAGMKGPRFPVAGERGSRPRAADRKRARSEPVDDGLLLDPCLDDPEQHLVFLEDGHVVSSTERGRITIEVLGLNRPALVEGRSETRRELRREWDQLTGAIDTPKGPSATHLEALFSVAHPFAALRRQLLAEWTTPKRQALDEVLGMTPEGPSSLEELTPDAPVPTRAVKRAARERFDVAQQAQEAYSVEEAEKKEEYFIRARLVDRIVIRNLKVVKNLELNLPTSADPDRTAWLTLLGENGSGKSSVLKAVGLALMGRQYRDALRLDASTYVRHGTRSGSVEVYLTGSAEPIRLEFRADSPQFSGTPEEPKVLLLGYGATRLLPPEGAPSPMSGAVARIDNLFDPFTPLADAHGWLLGLDDESFQHVARRLRKLLFLKPRARFDRERGKVEVSGIPLEQLSDGNQSVLALAVDIIAVMFTRWPALEAAEGIVLIDELGAHLHPRWRMRIVTSLREVFPRVQFIVSTHDPLCLSGLRNGEVVVMQRDAKGESHALTDVPPVEGLRVDQLLTSEFFGLYSTVDPSLDRLFDEFYLLKAKPRRTKADDERLAELEKALDGKRELGETRRDRIVLAAADDYLAKERRTVDPGERLALKEETKDKIVAVWERVAAGRRV